MNLDLGDTQRLMHESLQSFLEAEVPFDRVRALEREQGMDAALWKALAEQGWLGLPFAEAHGGGGGGLVDLGLLVECLARRAAMVPILEVAVCGRALAAGGLGDQWLPRIVAGDAIVVPAVLEAADRFDEVTLEVDDAGRLTGEKHFVDYGAQASHHLVAALRDGAVGLHLVEVAAGGVACEPLTTVGRTPTALVRYDGAPSLPVADARAQEELLLLARCLAAVQCVGSMAESLDQTVAYAKVREQFGKPIGSFQAVRHHCADMASRVASARDLCFEALSALQAGDHDPRRAAAAKAAASRSAPEVQMLAHQIHGGNGVIEENDLYFFTLRGKERSLAWGTVDECLDVLADRVDEPVDWL